MLVRAHKCARRIIYFTFFFNDTATTEIYTLSLHDALPICNSHGDLMALSADGLSGAGCGLSKYPAMCAPSYRLPGRSARLNDRDRKSTRLNSSHANISYAVFCLKKKNNTRSSTLHPMPTPL